jgi:hypothetical protein
LCFILSEKCFEKKMTSYWIEYGPGSSKAQYFRRDYGTREVHPISRDEFIANTGKGRHAKYKVSKDTAKFYSAGSPVTPAQFFQGTSDNDLIFQQLIQALNQRMSKDGQIPGVFVFPTLSTSGAVYIPMNTNDQKECLDKGKNWKPAEWTEGGADKALMATLGGDNKYVLQIQEVPETFDKAMHLLLLERLRDVMPEKERIFWAQCRRKEDDSKSPIVLKMHTLWKTDKIETFQNFLGKTTTTLEMRAAKVRDLQDTLVKLGVATRLTTITQEDLLYHSGRGQVLLWNISKAHIYTNLPRKSGDNSISLVPSSAPDAVTFSQAVADDNDAFRGVRGR